MASELAVLARDGASGALVVDGVPGGVAYLEDGWLSFAESPAAPDLGSRLVFSGRLSPRQWAQALEEATTEGIDVAILLISRGLVTRADLLSLLESVALDGLLALALPLTARSSPVTCSFVPRQSDPAGSMFRVDPTQAWAHAEQEARRLAALNIAADARPRRCDLVRPSAVLSSAQWAVASQADGRATVRDLARRSGFALSDTVERIGDLVRAGLCTVGTPVPVPAPVSAAGAVPTTAAPTTAANEPTRADDATPAPPAVAAQITPPASVQEHDTPPHVQNHEAAARVQEDDAAARVQEDDAAARVQEDDAAGRVQEDQEALPQRGAGGGFDGPRRVSRAGSAARRTPIDQALLNKVLEALKSLN